MVSMSRMLRNEKDVNDVLAYINTLSTEPLTNSVADATLQGGS